MLLRELKEKEMKYLNLIKLPFKLIVLPFILVLALFLVDWSNENDVEDFKRGFWIFIKPY